MAGLSLRADELARIGRMLADHGRFEGHRVLSEGFVRELVSPSANAGYGLQWWTILADVGTPIGFRGDGYLGQAVVVLPEAGLVAVRQLAWREDGEPSDSFRDFRDRVVALQRPTTP